MRRHACRERVAQAVLACAFALAASPRALSDERLPQRDPFGGFPERRSTSSPTQPWRGMLFAVPPHPSASALPGVPAEHPRVRGIVTGPRAFALVEIDSDVRIVRVGDVVGGARIVRIDAEAVWMSDRRRLALETHEDSRAPAVATPHVSRGDARPDVPRSPAPSPLPPANGDVSPTPSPYLGPRYVRPPQARS